MGLLAYSWNHEFKILNEGPFPVILRMDFLQRTQMRVDVCSRTYSFAFALSRMGSFSPANSEEGEEPFLQQLCANIANLTTITEAHPNELEWDSLKAVFPPILFFSRHGQVYSIRHRTFGHHYCPVATIPVCNPKLEIFKWIVNELQEQGVIRPSKSQYASPAFLVPKGGDGFRMLWITGK